MRRLAVTFGFAGLLAGLALAVVFLWPFLFAPRAHNVVLITVDTLRADRLGAYGYGKARTPAMDGLAAEGARFSTAYCDVSWTTASMASVMTGTYPPRHGVQLHTNRLPQDRLTLAEIVKSQGLVTGAIVGSFPLDPVYGLDQGFDSYDATFTTPMVYVPGVAVKHIEITVDEDSQVRADSTDAKILNDAYRSDADVTRAAVAWLENNSKNGSFLKKRSFLWVHYFGPHEKIRGDRRGAQRKLVISEYDGDTHETDVAVGHLLDAIDRLGLRDDTLVILHSDHGQALGEHGIVGHGRDLYEETVRIPLFARLPGLIPAGVVVDSVVRNVDILPTVLDYLDIDVPADLDGRSLRPLIDGTKDREEPAYMELAYTPPIPVDVEGVGEFFGPTAWHSLRLGNRKYLVTTVGSPCDRNPKRYGLDTFGINPARAIGASTVPDDQCGNFTRKELYEFDGSGYGGENWGANVASKQSDVVEMFTATIDRIASNREQSERFTLDEEQERKLKSLGYLQ